MAIKPIGCRADKEEICLCKSLFETHFISGNKSPEIRGANLAYPWAHKHFNYALDIIVARNLRGKARTSNAGHVLPKKYPQPQMGVALVVDFQGPVVYICKSISLWLWKQFENCFEPFWGKSSDKRLANKETHKLTHASPRTHTHAGPTHTHTETSSVKVWKFHFTNGQREKSSVGIEWNANKVFNWKWDIIFIL